MPRPDIEPSASPPQLPAQLHTSQDTQNSELPTPSTGPPVETPSTQAQVSPSTSAATRVSSNARHRSRTAGTPDTTASTELTRVSVPPLSSVPPSKTSPKTSAQPFSRFNDDGREVVQLTDYARAASASTGMAEDQEDDDRAHGSVSVDLGGATKWENASESGFGVGVDSGSVVETGCGRTRIERESMSPLTDLSDEEEAEPARRLRERRVVSGSDAATKKSKGKKRKFAEFDEDQGMPVSASGCGSANDLTKTKKKQKKKRMAIPPPSEDRLRELLGADGRVDWPVRIDGNDAVKEGKVRHLWLYLICNGSC